MSKDAGKKPFDPRQYIVDLLVKFRKETESLMYQAMRTIAQVPDRKSPEVAERLHILCDQQLLPIYSGDHSIACNTGCNHCCRYQVGLYLPEANRIRDFIQAYFSEEQKKHVLEECRSYQVGNMCPLNEEGKCSVYELRPLTCRRCNGYDPEKCSDLDPPEPPPFNKRAFALGTAICAGLQNSGVQHRLLVDFLIEILNVPREVSDEPGQSANDVPGLPSPSDGE